jgi:hypothetical protein
MADQMKCLISKYQQRIMETPFAAGHLSGVKGLELTVMRTVNFSRISSWTWILESSF